MGIKYYEIIVRNIIFITIIIAIVSSWIYVFNQAQNLGEHSMVIMISIIPFLIMWTIMMIAMMFPSLFPMVASFRSVYNLRKIKGKSIVPIWVFLCGYILVWILFGLFAYISVIMVIWIVEKYPQIQNYTSLAIGILFIVVGIYQVTRFKHACLTKCRSPMEFIRTSWREGYKGALIMGFEHGLYCLGCCWLLFLLMFPLGFMNITAMGILTLVVFAEKTLYIGHELTKFFAIILISMGIVIIIFPNIVP